MVKKTKILICGDSFSTVWPETKNSWMSLLSEKFEVTNLSQAGVGEYKIFKQLKSIDVSNFDFTIVSHTSPSRIHTNNHPLHKTDLHKNCDLIYSDLENRFNWFNENLMISKKFFEYHYDDEYQKDIYFLIRNEIKKIITNKYLSICHVEIASELSCEEDLINFSELWKNNKGLINHYNEQGNKIIYETLLEKLIV
jgi:hypothetical protein